eukprot:CAMPEP_0168453888 /NCGR_PEP_ID=MMETSP0228-20121227/49925_1 /TAXON_ID=133427 /ORGANISM="Protoceratium reticulatum, Strain CCCM 535 (=CCMP 1889)" /LENGTH=66 /DNA_ID=CAMNT_0008468633 /DNA_START=39 /DNA_END=235 /DNA_ORIENTATION=+
MLTDLPEMASTQSWASLALRALARRRGSARLDGCCLLAHDRAPGSLEEVSERALACLFVRDRCWVS